MTIENQEINDIKDKEIVFLCLQWTLHALINLPHTLPHLA